MFTQLALSARPCCGNGCRHCPYGHYQVQGRPRVNIPARSCLMMPRAASSAAVAGDAGAWAAGGVGVVELRPGWREHAALLSPPPPAGPSSCCELLVYDLSMRAGASRMEVLADLDRAMEASHGSGRPLAVLVGEGGGGGGAGAGAAVTQWRALAGGGWETGDAQGVVRARLMALLAE